MFNVLFMFFLIKKNFFNSILYIYLYLYLLKLGTFLAFNINPFLYNITIVY